MRCALILIDKLLEKKVRLIHMYRAAHVMINVINSAVIEELPNSLPCYWISTHHRIGGHGVRPSYLTTQRTIFLMLHEKSGSFSGESSFTFRSKATEVRS